MDIVLFFTWLTPPQANDRHLESAGQTEIFRKHPRKASILNMPLVTTLFYSCFYHYTEAEVQAERERKAPHILTAQDEHISKPVLQHILFTMGAHNSRQSIWEAFPALSRGEPRGEKRSVRVCMASSELAWSDAAPIAVFVQRSIVSNGFAQYREEQRGIVTCGYFKKIF